MTASKPNSNKISSNGKSGDDQLLGGNQGGHLVGGSGNDTFYTSGGGNRVTAGSGNDVIVHKLDLSATSNEFHGGSGRDTLRLEMSAAQYNDPRVQSAITELNAHFASGKNSPFTSSVLKLTAQSFDFL